MILRASSGWPGGIQCPHQVAPAAAKSASRSWFPLTLMSYPASSRPASLTRPAMSRTSSGSRARSRWRQAPSHWVSRRRTPGRRRSPPTQMGILGCCTGVAGRCSPSMR